MTALAAGHAVTTGVPLLTVKVRKLSGVVQQRPVVKAGRLVAAKLPDGVTLNKVKLSPLARLPPLAVTVSVPPALTLVAPATCALARVTTPLRSRKMAVPARVSELLRVSVPGASAPGASVPPALTMTAPPIVPVPPNAAPVPTVTVLAAASEPLTNSVPPLTIVPPV